ncbi:MAG: hypothetical protein WDZ94_00990 [Patescibacteria group bacterium]
MSETQKWQALHESDWLAHNSSQGYSHNDSPLSSHAYSLEINNQAMRRLIAQTALDTAPKLVDTGIVYKTQPPGRICINFKELAQQLDRDGRHRTTLASLVETEVIEQLENLTNDNIKKDIEHYPVTYICEIILSIFQIMILSDIFAAFIAVWTSENGEPSFFSELSTNVYFYLIATIIMHIIGHELTKYSYLNPDDTPMYSKDWYQQNIKDRNFLSMLTAAHISQIVVRPKTTLALRKMKVGEKLFRKPKSRADT